MTPRFPLQFRGLSALRTVSPVGFLPVMQFSGLGSFISWEPGIVAHLIWFCGPMMEWLILGISTGRQSFCLDPSARPMISHGGYLFGPFELTSVFALAAYLPCVILCSSSFFFIINYLFFLFCYFFFSFSSIFFFTYFFSFLLIYYFPFFFYYSFLLFVFFLRFYLCFLFSLFFVVFYCFHYYIL